MFILVVDKKEKRCSKLINAIREKWRIEVRGDPGIDGGVSAVGTYSDRLRGGKIFWWPGTRIEEIWASLGGNKGHVQIIQILDEESRAWVSGTGEGRVEIATDADDSELERALEDWLPSRPAPPQLPTLDDLRTHDVRVFRMVRNLGPNAVDTVRELVFQLFPEAVGQVELRWLGEGYSTSQLFRIAFSSEEHVRHDRVLKLTPASQRQKCLDELANYPVVASEHERKYGDLVPLVYRNQSGACTPNGEPGLAAFGEWVALGYDFFGGEDEEFCDLAEAYLLPHQTRLANLRRCDADPAQRVLECCLNPVRSRWYMKGTIENLALWSADDKERTAAPYRMPPYGFRSAEKRAFSKMLHNLERYGDCLLMTTWEQQFRVVERLIWDGFESSCDLVRTPVPVLLSQTHGDMNGGNLRCNVDQERGFLIDLACYRSSNHTLQDFARLEVEVKLVLMDTGPDCNPHHDLGPNGFGAWVYIENTLSRDNWRGELEVAMDASQCAKRALKLISFIRRQAWETQQALGARCAESQMDFGRFLPAYRVALLYETIRAIGWSSLPIPKRVLAVHSAATLLEMLERAT